MKRVFISYAPEDIAFRDTLTPHLHVLRSAGITESWHDGQLQPGEDRRVTIDRELHAADVIVLLISASYLASESHQQLELEPALARWRKNKAMVIPVIVRACDWEVSPIAQLQVLPSQGKPVAAWPQQDDAWTDVVRKIRAATTRIPMSSLHQPMSHSTEAEGSGKAQAETIQPSPIALISNERTQRPQEDTQISPTRHVLSVAPATASFPSGSAALGARKKGTEPRKDFVTLLRRAIIEGVWVAAHPSGLYCVRIVNNQIRVAYSYSGRDRLTGEYHDCSVAGNTIVGRFRWVDDRFRGYFYWRIRSTDSIIGGWWYERDIEPSIKNDLFLLNESIDGMTPTTLRREPFAPTPQWAEQFFEMIARS